MSEHLSGLKVSDTGFVFDQLTGQTFRLNKTGIEIIKMLQDGFDNEAISESLCDHFDITKEKALTDVEEFLSFIDNLGLTVND